VRARARSIRWLNVVAVLAATLAAAQASVHDRTAKHQVPGPITIPAAALEPLAWSELAGWAQDNHAEAFAAFRASCRALVVSAKWSRDKRPIHRPLVAVCRKALAVAAPLPARARAFFEANFRPLRIRKLGDEAGFLTGYYEPIVEGSRFPTRIFNVPVHRRPHDLIPPSAAARGAGFSNGGRALRQLADGTLGAYFERGEIEDGALDGRGLEICWLKDPIDLFFIQIQGSGRVRLEDGTMLRINYDAHNGHPYTAIGRVLIDRKIVAREEMSMDRLRAWMAANPQDGRELRRQNKSYVFFRIVGLSEEREALGAQGVPLAPRRSIAVDKELHVYGTPFFIDAALPLADARVPFRRLMIAQDTGSAIVGPARADIYFGAGEEAGRIAGRLRHPGDFALLIPRALDPVVAGTHMPLPRPRPPIKRKRGRA